jgi:hypothetical protein
MKPFCRYGTALSLVSIFALTSCATSSRVLLGTARPPISADDVTVLLQAPETFEEIAEIKASSGVSLQSADQKWDRAIEGLMREAALVGANAIVVEIPEESNAGEVAVSASKPTTTTGGRAPELGLGISTKTAPLTQSLRALAIYIPD